MTFNFTHYAVLINDVMIVNSELVMTSKEVVMSCF